MNIDWNNSELQIVVQIKPIIYLWKIKISTCDYDYDYDQYIFLNYLQYQYSSKFLYN